MKVTVICTVYTPSDDFDKYEYTTDKCEVYINPRYVTKAYADDCTIYVLGEYGGTKPMMLTEESFNRVVDWMERQQ